MGFVTAMQVTFPLEELAFGTPPGEVSGILRTSNAYHLVKVHQQEESRGSLWVSRIFKNGGPGFTDQHNHKVVSELDSLRQLLLRGEDFNYLSRKHSDILDEEFDPELPLIRSRGRNEKLVDAAFGRDDPGLRDNGKQPNRATAAATV